MTRYTLEDNEDDGVGVDEKFEEAVELVVREGAGSASLLQRRLEVGYARAVRILDQLEKYGVLGHAGGNKPRQVIVSSIEDIINVRKSMQRKVDADKIESEEPFFEWVPMDLNKLPYGSFQQEFREKSDVHMPMGFDEKHRVTAIPLARIGHLYVFYSPMCGAVELIKNSLSVMVNTFKPENLKCIIFDETAGLNTYLIPYNDSLLTGIIDIQNKLVNALKWSVTEHERRIRLFKEMRVTNMVEYNNQSGFQPMPRILIVINSPSGQIAHNEEIRLLIENLSTAGQITGITLVLISPLNDKKFSNVLTSFPTKIIFKTFSTSQADLLGTDDAFDLASGDELLFLPAYGKMEKLSVD